MKPQHTKRESASGRYAQSQRCDACGCPVGTEYGTDDEVCGVGDGPGFYLCSRARCVGNYRDLDVEARRQLFTAQRAKNNGLGR